MVLRGRRPQVRPKNDQKGQPGKEAIFGTCFYDFCLLVFWELLFDTKIALKSSRKVGPKKNAKNGFLKSIAVGPPPVSLTKVHENLKLAFTAKAARRFSALKFMKTSSLPAQLKLLGAFRHLRRQAGTEKRRRGRAASQTSLKKKSCETPATTQTKLA